MAEDEGTGLSEGQIEAMIGGEKNLDGYLQVIEIQQNTPRKKIVLSDGSKSCECVLASQCEACLTEIEVGTILQLSKYNCSSISGKKMIIVLGVEVTQKECEKLGNPRPANQNATAPRVQNSFRSQQKRPSLGLLSSSSGQGEFMPISSLNPFSMNRNACIRVRVTEKDDVRTWSNARGTGKLFSFSVMDKDGGEIRITAFNDECEKFCPLVEENGTYTIKRFRVKQDTYKSRVKNDYAITLERDTIIEAIEESENFAQQTLEFTSIGDLEGMEIGEKESIYVNMMVYVREVGELQQFTSRSGKDLTKRDLSIADHTNVSITCTLWGKTAENMDANALPVGTVLCLPNSRVSSFGGRSVSANSVKTQNLDKHEIYQQVQAAASGPNDQEIKKLTSRGGGRKAERLTWEEVVDQRKGWNDSNDSDFKGDYFEVPGVIRYVRCNYERPPWYKSAPTGESKAKVVEENGQWVDHKNNKRYDSYKPRYVLNFQFVDHTGGQYVGAFDEEAQKIMGISASDLEKFVENGDEAGFEKPFAQANFKECTMKIRAKPDEYNGVTKIRYSVMEMVEIDYLLETQKLYEEICEKYGA